MDFTEEEKEVITRMLDFCEENWAGFTGRCDEAGLDAAHVDLSCESIRNKVVGE